MLEQKGTVQVYEEHVVDFYGDSLVCVKDEHGRVWFPLRRPCDYLGLAFQSQSTKVKSDPRFTANDIVIRGSDGKHRTFLCLPVDQAQGWLFSINSNKVAETQRPKLLCYQQECVRVLNDYWTKGIAVNPRVAELDEASVRLIVNQTIDELIKSNYLPREQAQQVCEKDIQTILSAVSQLPNLSDWAQWRIKNYLDDYLKIKPEEDISKIIMGVTPLTPELLARLHLGERWCVDKIGLYFPREAGTRKKFKELCNQHNIPVNNYSYPINRPLQCQMFRDQFQYKRRTEDMVIYYNFSKETVTRNCNSIRKELEVVFANNRVQVPYGGYNDYIRSAEWYNKRDAFRAVLNICWDCEIVLTPMNQVVHHLTYDRLGHEKLEDLISLCKRCHSVRHPEKQ